MHGGAPLWAERVLVVSRTSLALFLLAKRAMRAKRARAAKQQLEATRPHALPLTTQALGLLGAHDCQPLLPRAPSDHKRQPCKGYSLAVLGIVMESSDLLGSSRQAAGKAKCTEGTECSVGAACHAPNPGHVLPLTAVQEIEQQTQNGNLTFAGEAEGGAAVSMCRGTAAYMSPWELAQHASYSPYAHAPAIFMQMRAHFLNASTALPPG